MFKDIKITKSGRQIIDLASKKEAVLAALIDRLKEQYKDVDKYNLPAIEKDKTRLSIRTQIDKAQQAIHFLIVIQDHIENAENYDLNINELNFLQNETVVDYEGR